MSAPPPPAHPPYVFKVDELRENPATRPNQDNRGYWVPTLDTGWNYKSHGEGVTDTYWLCDGSTIHLLPNHTIPPLEHYKTFSVFYCAGLGFYVLHGDGTAPAPGETWRTIRFDPVTDGSSHLTPTGASETLQWQRADQQWAERLLPNIYRGTQTQDPRLGGLQGELPIFLALAAMSMGTASLPQYLPWMFQNSRWHMHSLNIGGGWIHKRGVVVDVYTCPTIWQGGSTAQDLANIEIGAYGKYYY